MKRTFVPLLTLSLTVLLPCSLAAQNVSLPKQPAQLLSHASAILTEAVSRGDTASLVLYRPDVDKFSLKHPIYRPGVDKFEIRHPIYRPGIDQFKMYDLRSQPGSLLERANPQKQKQMGIRPTSNIYERSSGITGTSSSVPVVGSERRDAKCTARRQRS